MPLKNNWVNGDLFTPAAANDMANAVNGATNVTVDGAAASSYEIDPTPLTASDVGAYTREEVDEAIDAAKNGPVITNSPSITSPRINSIYDTNGVELLKLGPIPNAVNFLQIANGTGANGPVFEAQGTGTNLSFTFTPKGSGGIGYYLGTGQTSAKIFAAGTAANINVELTPQGSGVVTAGGVQVLTTTGTATVTNKDLTSGTNTFPTFNQSTTGNAANVTGTVAVANGGTGSTSLVTTATASSVAARDSNGNISADKFLTGFTTTATAGATTTLTVNSTQIQAFTGTLAQTVTLPTTSLPAGAQYTIINNSTGAVTVQSSGANTVVIMAAATEATFTALVATPTTAAHWEDTYQGGIVASGKALTVNNTLTFSGTDGTTMTFPTTSATLARTDAANTFTGVQTMTSPSFTTPVLGTPSSGTLTNCTSLPVSGITASTSAALGVGSVELGHATDTTLTRSAAGKLAVEGVDVLLNGGALGTPASGTLTNCTFPTLNQNTTGSAASLTTARTIDGQSFNGTANITVIAPGTNAATQKTAFVDADAIPLVDSEASNVLKKATWADLKSAFASVYFDESFRSVVALLNGDGANNSTTISDLSPLYSNWTANGAAKLSTSVKKYGTASVNLDGTSGTFISAPAAVVFGTGDFTIEMWVYFASNSGTQMIYDTRPAATNGLYPTIYMTTGLLRYFNNSADQISGATTVSATTWNHVCVSRIGSTTKMFLNGTQQGSSYTDSSNYVSSTPRIGADRDGANRMNGYVDDVRITKGVGRYSANFTPLAWAAPIRL
jgi:hypothetical protein